MSTPPVGLTTPLPQLLFLIGYRGTGKSTVARLLAERLRWTWLDADAMLEARFGRSIRQIFQQDGEPAFRLMEAAVLEDLCRLRRHVVATGGGVVLHGHNRDRLRAAGRVVWLTADADTIWTRLKADAATAERRPALTVGGLAEVKELLRVREPLYRACADWTVDTVGRTPTQVADLILANWTRDE
jgi:shikimate kinase